MILNQASSRSILQVWFSTGWSKDTLKEFTKACNELVESNELQDKIEANLIKYWSSKDVTLKTALENWFKWKSPEEPFEPCANFKLEVDRVNYARYVITGYIFEEKEENLSHGNRTMFSFPPNVNVTARDDHENFYYTFDVSNNFDIEYKGSLKLSADTYMMKKMDMLRKLVNEKSLKMTFKQGFVSKTNPTLSMKIRSMNPTTIDWSNIPEYFFPNEIFFDMAKKMSGENTIHYLHLMYEWQKQVHGLSLDDFPEDDWKEVLESCMDR